MPRNKISSSMVSRSTSEQQRRNQLKSLLSSLASALQLRPSMERTTVPALLEHARDYVIALKERVNSLKKTKEELEAKMKLDIRSNIVPVVKTTFNEADGDLEVNLIVGINRNFVLSEVISILEEEGANVLCVTYSIVGCKIVHTIICQAVMARIGIDGSRVLERVKRLVSGHTSPAVMLSEWVY